MRWHDHGHFDMGTKFRPLKVGEFIRVGFFDESCIARIVEVLDNTAFFRRIRWYEFPAFWLRGKAKEGGA